MNKKPLYFIGLLIALSFVLSLQFSSNVYAQAQDCTIPESGPWPPCATGGSSSSNNDCVIPESGPWPPCATNGGNSSSNNDCVIPESGPWPPCATNGGSSGSNTNTGSNGGCVIPASGPWPPCATNGGGGSSNTNTGSNGGCVIPASGPWPPCATNGGGGSSNTNNDTEDYGILTSPKGNGFYTVGEEIMPGKWRSTGTGSGCYWARLDANQDTLDNHYGNAGGTVNIRPTDYEVEFDDCGTWQYVENEVPVLQGNATAPKWDGFYTVGVEIAPGIWESTGTNDDCYWSRLDGNQEIIDNHYGNAGGRVNIKPTDYEVEFDDCGLWEYKGS